MKFKATPSIPNWMRAASTSGAFRNVFEADLCPDETRVFGTESLLGNWNAEILLLAQDFGPTSLIRARLTQGDMRPYRHTDWKTERALGARTNRTLAYLSSKIHCEKLYGSAMGCLLRNDGSETGFPADFDKVRRYCLNVLRFTIRHMVNLRAIACLGTVSWSLTTDLLGHHGLTHREWRRARCPLIAGGLQVFALAHTRAFFGGKQQVEGDWAAMAVSLGLKHEFLKCQPSGENPKTARTHVVQ
jgi:hypothetical protein